MKRTREVWFTIYQHRHGDDIALHSTEAAAQAAFIDTAREQWAREIIDAQAQPVPMPEPFDRAAAERYFELMADTEWWISGSAPVQFDEPEPPAPTVHLFRFIEDATSREVMIEAETFEKAAHQFFEQQGWSTDEEDEENGGWID